MKKSRPEGRLGVKRLTAYFDADGPDAGAVPPAVVAADVEPAGVEADASAGGVVVEGAEADGVADVEAEASAGVVAGAVADGAGVDAAGADAAGVVDVDAGAAASSFLPQAASATASRDAINRVFFMIFL